MQARMNCRRMKNRRQTAFLPNTASSSKNLTLTLMNFWLADICGFELSQTSGTKVAIMLNTVINNYYYEKHDQNVMNRSFDQVIRSSINRSPTKEAHAFPHAPRFQKGPSHLCAAHAYDLARLDLSSQIPKRPDSTSKSPRFRYRTHSEGPAPNSYTHRSFLEEGRGHKLGQAARSPKPRIQTSPSPNTYDPKILRKSPQITMSPRLIKPQKPQHLVGPGAYDIGKYDTVATKRSQIYSKYSSTSFYKIGNDKRFEKKGKQFGPGPGAYSWGTGGTHSRQTYSFSHQKRASFPVVSSISPGPGAYQQFSEFAERRHHLESKLDRLSSLIHSHRHD